MGLARRNPGGQWRLGLSATAASAVLYSAIVLFGVGSASPSALGAAGDRYPSVVLIPQHADTVSGSVQKLPQASPEPGRRHFPRHVRTPRSGVVPTTRRAAPPTVESAPPSAPARGSTASPGLTKSSTASALVPVQVVPLPEVPVPVVTVPELPVSLPELPVQLPELPVKLPDLPVKLPDLPATPPLPLALP
jgi:hypothetical protein